MEYVKVANVADFATLRVKSFRILTRYVGVFKEDDGSFRAIEVACKHQNADLTQGKIKGDIVICPWHGWRYNLRTGECLWGNKGKLRPYGCKVEDDVIYITLNPLQSWD